MSRMGKARVRPIVKQSPTVGDDYLDLIKEFPLRPIRSKEEFSAAGAILDRLIGREDLTPGQRDYLSGLVRFVEDHEQEQRTAWLKGQTPIELLKHLMEENDMNRSDLGYVLGSRGLASEVLSGKRGLSKLLIGKLAARFGVDAGLFLDTGIS